jgi:hypothetical protein
MNAFVLIRDVEVGDRFDRTSSLYSDVLPPAHFFFLAAERVKKNTSRVKKNTT